MVVEDSVLELESQNEITEPLLEYFLPVLYHL